VATATLPRRVDPAAPGNSGTVPEHAPIEVGRKPVTVASAPASGAGISTTTRNPAESSDATAPGEAMSAERDVGSASPAATNLPSGVAIQEERLAEDEMPHGGAERLPQDEPLMDCEDELPQGALRRLGTLRWRHLESVNSVVFSKDGSRVISAGHDAVIYVWAAEDGQVRFRLDGHAGPVNQCVCTGGDGEYVVSAGTDGSLRKWNLADGKQKKAWGGLGEITCVACSAEDRFMVAGTRAGRLMVWDGDMARAPQELEAHAGSVRCLQFSASGDVMASGGDDGMVRLWRTSPALQQVGGMKAHADHVAGVAFSPDGGILASVGGDQDLRLWEVKAVEKPWRECDCRTTGVCAIAFSPDGDIVAAGGESGFVTVWDVKSGKPPAQFRADFGCVRALAFSPDGATLAIGGQGCKLRFLRRATWRETLRTMGHEHRVAGVRFAPDGVTLATCGDDHTIRLWDWRTGAERFVLADFRSWVPSLTFSPQGDILTGIGGHSDTTLRVWRVDKGELAKTIAVDAQSLRAVAVDPQGEWSFLAADNSVRLLDAASGQVLRTLGGHWKPVVALLPVSGGLISAGADGCIRLWDLSIKESPPARPTTSEEGAEADKDSDGEGGISGSQRAAEDPRIAAAATRLELRADSPVVCVAVDRQEADIAALQQNAVLASGHRDHSIRVWDLRGDGRQLAKLEGHTGAVTGLRFAADPYRRALISSSLDGTVRFWALAWGQEILRLAVGDGPALSADLSPKGEVLAVGTGRGTVLLWDIHSLHVEGRFQRDWTFADGRTASLELLHVGRGMVTLRKPGGNPVGIPVEKLDESSRRLFLMDVVNR